FQRRDSFRILRRVELRRDDDHRFFDQLRRKAAQLFHDDVEIMHRIAPTDSETSTRCASSRVRSMWRRNWMPKPCPVCAPSINPGMSATTNVLSSMLATPRFGSSVVNG